MSQPFNGNAENIWVRVLGGGGTGTNILGQWVFPATVNVADPVALTDGQVSTLSVDSAGRLRCLITPASGSSFPVTPVNLGDTVYNAGKAAAPAGGTVIATITPGAGYWEVDTSIDTTGEVVANNLEMRKAGAVLYTPLFVPPTGAVSGEAAIQEKFFITLAAGNTLDVRAIAAATGGSTYQASIRARRLA